MNPSFLLAIWTAMVWALASGYQTARSNENDLPKPSGQTDRGEGGAVTEHQQARQTAPNKNCVAPGPWENLPQGPAVPPERADVHEPDPAVPGSGSGTTTEIPEVQIRPDPRPHTKQVKSQTGPEPRMEVINEVVEVVEEVNGNETKWWEMVGYPQSFWIINKGDKSEKAPKEKKEPPNGSKVA